MTGQPKESVSRGAWKCLHGEEPLASIMKEKYRREAPGHSDAASGEKGMTEAVDRIGRAAVV